MVAPDCNGALFSDTLLGSVSDVSGSQRADAERIGQPCEFAYRRVDFCGGLAFFRHPRLHLRKRQLEYHRHPIIYKLPFMTQEAYDNPVLEIFAEVLNFSGFLPIVRATDCHAQVMFLGTQKNKVITALDDRIWDNGKSSLTMHTGLHPRSVRLFALDTMSHIIVEKRDDEDGEITPAILPNGEYRMIIVLDAEDTMSTEQELGTFNFPDSFLAEAQAETSSYDVWKGRVSDTGYAIFIERTREGKNIANVVGKVPDKRLAELKSKELKGFEVRTLWPAPPSS